MTIKVIKPGLFSVFQDTGRTGFQHWGVPVTGAMDQDAHALANLLVGNCAGFSTLEMTLQGPTLCFQAKALIAIAGADLGARLDGAVLKPGQALIVRPGAVLDFGKREHGARAYLAVSGGFLLAPVMNSVSTYTRGGFGGWQGRALRSGDLIPVCSSFTNPPRVNTPSDLLPDAPANPATIRVVRGREWNDFSVVAQHDFLSNTYKVTGDSDRMGYRLDGVALGLSTPREMLSESVTFGTVQVPPNGLPLILMADRQTTGGYPRIAHVASVDLPRLAQVLPGHELRFSLIDLRASQELFVARARTIRKLEAAHAIHRRQQ